MSFCRNFFSKLTQDKEKRKRENKNEDAVKEQNIKNDEREEQTEEEEEEEEDVVRRCKRPRQAVIESDSDGDLETKDGSRQEEMETNSAACIVPLSSVIKTPPKRATG